MLAALRRAAPAVQRHAMPLFALHRRWFAVSGLHPGEQELLEGHADVPLERTRNFCIIAHIDHGKSTLSDRLLEMSGNIPKVTKGGEQVLDSLDVERQRGITVKAQTASMLHTHTDGLRYLLNLVDTPGHVDFSHEVSRSLAACQGALLLVDCAQGVQAQTVANYHAARDAGLSIVPVLTKIDLPTADPEPALEALEAAFGIPPEEVIWTSAKSGDGCGEILPAVISRLGSPVSAGRQAPLRALLVDSWFDTFRGVVCLLQVVDGTLRVGDRVVMAHSGSSYEVQEVGLMTPRKVPVATSSGPAKAKVAPSARLAAGQVGYVILGMKSTKQAPVGDTLMSLDAVEAAGGDRALAALPGFQPAKPMVFASMFPVDTSQFEGLQTAVERLTLNDASVSVTRESSPALGFGLRCGFLGLLHMDVFHQRLQDEFDTPVIATAPMVPYQLTLKGGQEVTVEKPTEFPPAHEVVEYREPIVRARVIVPEDKLAAVMSLMFDRRGVQEDLTYMAAAEASSSTQRVVLTYELPWAEVVSDFFDVLKSVSAGYATFDYEPAGYRPADIVCVDVLINKTPVDALSFVAFRDRAQKEGRAVIGKLRSLIKRQQFEVVIQAAVGTKVFARERIPPYRKDVLTKSGKTVGGGDMTRKRKLLEKQKRGKARMKTVGNVALSQEAFMSLMSRGSSGTTGQ